jgi:hypothetical protein
MPSSTDRTKRYSSTHTWPSARRGWVVSIMPQERDPVPIVQEAGWASWPPGWVQKISPPPGFEPWTMQPAVSCYTDLSISASNNVCILIFTIYVKQSHYKPGQAFRVPGGWGSQIFRHLAYEGGMAVSPTHRPPLSPRRYLWCSFLLEAESNPGPQCDWKDYVNEKFQWHHQESNLRPSGL